MTIDRLMSEISDSKLPTSGQLERELSQAIARLYRDELGHSPGKITCKFFGNYLAIVIEKSRSTLERTLLKENQHSVFIKFNLAINNLVKSRLKVLIEQKLAVKVSNILFDSNLTTPHTGAIFILKQPPIVRPRRTTAKNKKNQLKNNKIDENNLN